MAAVQKLALVRLWMCVVRFSQEIESLVKMKLFFYVCEKGLGCLELSYMYFRNEMEVAHTHVFVCSFYYLQAP